MSCWNDFDHPPRPGVRLAERTTWGIGGPASWYAEPSTVDQARRLLARARDQRMPVYVLGRGSNLLVDDAGVDGLVLRLQGASLAEIQVDPDAARMTCGAGALLAEAVRLAAEHGLANLEALAGIPGTMGGAVRMNAGDEQGIGRWVEAVETLDLQGRTARRTRDELKFGYRHSNLDECVVTEVVLALAPESPESVRERTRAQLARKQRTQPLDARSAGCVFRNPPGASAGALIDAAGCKGWAEGAAVVSERHANYILNRGKATAAQVRRLIDRVREAVARAHGVELELEVTVWP